MDFNCPLAVSSPDAAVLSDIFVWLLVDYLNEYAYYAQAAGLDYGLSLSDNGFELSLAGFNHKLRILLEAVIQKMANFQVKPDRFSVVKVYLLIDFVFLSKIARLFILRFVHG